MKIVVFKNTSKLSYMSLDLKTNQSFIGRKKNIVLDLNSFYKKSFLEGFGQTKLCSRHSPHARKFLDCKKGRTARDC